MPQDNDDGLSETHRDSRDKLCPEPGEIPKQISSPLKKIHGNGPLGFHSVIFYFLAIEMAWLLKYKVDSINY